MLGAEATIVTSSNADDGISCVPEPEETVSITENENTQPLQPQTPPRPGTLALELHQDPHNNVNFMQF